MSTSVRTRGFDSEHWYIYLPSAPYARYLRPSSPPPLLISTCRRAEIIIRCTARLQQDRVAHLPFRLSNCFSTWPISRVKSHQREPHDYLPPAARCEVHRTNPQRKIRYLRYTTYNMRVQGALKLISFTMMLIAAIFILVLGLMLGNAEAIHTIAGVPMAMIRNV